MRVLYHFIRVWHAYSEIATLVQLHIRLDMCWARDVHCNGVNVRRWSAQIADTLCVGVVNVDAAALQRPGAEREEVK